jgi:nitrate reductase gamma subunit
MWDKIYYFVLVHMVYIAVAVLIGGTLFKLVVILFSKKFKGSLATYPLKVPRPVGVAGEAILVPSAWRKAKVFWFFIVTFHIALALLVLGHLELIKEFKLIQIIPHTVFLGKGWVGIVIILTVLYFLFRRFRSPWREISIPEDFFILLLLFVTSVIGSHLHMGERYGMAEFGVNADLYREYFSSLVALKPAIPEGISGSPHYVLVALHIFLGNLVLMMLPFTKMIHMVFTFLSLNLKRK